MHVLFTFIPSGWPTIVEKNSIEYSKIRAKVGYKEQMEGSYRECKIGSIEIMKRLNERSKVQAEKKI